MCSVFQMQMPGVKAYKISTIVDMQAQDFGSVLGVKAYKISTIVDVSTLNLLRNEGVKAYNNFGVKSIELRPKTRTSPLPLP